VRGTWIGPLTIALGWLMYSAGESVLWLSGWHAGAIVILVGCLLSTLGRDALVAFLPAFVALFFMVPIPGPLRQEIALPLQTITAQITQQAFELCGVLVNRSNNMLSINGVDVTIIEACNGMRMVSALLLVSYAFAFASPWRWYVRLLIILGSPICAVLCNVVRLVPTIWIYGHYSSSVGDRFHSLSGWIMLFLAFAILVGLLRFLRWALIPVTQYTLAHD
jgi:exosortase